MNIGSVDHVNIKSPRFDESLHLYHDILGLSMGRLPDVSRMAGAGAMPRSAYLCDATGRAIIHMSAAEGDASARTGAIDHIALRCEGFAEFARRLEESDTEFRKAIYPEIGVAQLVLTDPNGIKIELSFSVEDAQS